MPQRAIPLACGCPARNARVRTCVAQLDLLYVSKTIIEVICSDVAAVKSCGFLNSTSRLHHGLAQFFGRNLRQSRSRMSSRPRHLCWDALRKRLHELVVF